jgi:dipeptidyl aminopeptidase/acylaminoacyl peptidase
MKYQYTRPKSHKILTAARYLLALTLASGVVAASAFIVYGFWHQHIEAGQFNVSDTYPGENLSHSLDLKLAVKANYPSPALTVVKDLGSSDGLHHQIISFDVSTDNLTEYGLMMTPAGAPPAQGFPTLILLHGFSNPSRYSTTDSYVQDMEFYASHGFAVIKPDYRGQGLSIGHGLPDSAYYSMAYNIDVMSLISALKATSFINKSDINLWGHSLGAYIALRAAVLSKDIKNVILLAGPVDSLKEMYLTYVPPSDERNPYALATRNDVFTKYGIPADNSQFWQDASPIDYLSLIKAQIQIHVGLQDQVVPPQFSADLDLALNHAHIKHQYFVYADGDHSLAAQRSLIWARSLQALEAQPAPPSV